MKKKKLNKYIIFVLSICFLLNINLYANGKTVNTAVNPVIKSGIATVGKIVSIDNKKVNKINTSTDGIGKQVARIVPNTSKTDQSLSNPKTVINKKFEQLLPPVKGEEIAVIRTKLGVIKIKLLSNYAPKAVEIFKNRVNSGFYNGLSFNKLIGNSIIQGGTSQQNDEISTVTNNNLDVYNPEIRNFKGAVAIANGDSGSIDKFVIVQAGPGKIVKDTLSYMKNAGEKLFPKQVITKYQKIGGAPWLDYQNVIFGQVFSGMEIIDKISKSAVDETNMIKKEIKITKIVIQKYK